MRKKLDTLKRELFYDTSSYIKTSLHNKSSYVKMLFITKVRTYFCIFFFHETERTGIFTKMEYLKKRQGARAKDYELALAWLSDCGLVRQVHNVTKPALPLKAYEDFGAFKLFLVDVGLLGAMADLDVRTLLDGQTVFQEFKGALTEQYVLQQLTTRNDLSIYYWSPENARAEIDFLAQQSGEIIPIEVKAEENLRAKSLRVYYDKYQPSIAIRTSMSNYRKESWMCNVPLYAILTI